MFHLNEQDCVRRDNLGKIDSSSGIVRGKTAENADFS